MNDNYGLVYKPPQNSDPLPPPIKFLDDSWVVKIEASPESQLQEEWGTCGNVCFTHVTLHDSEGKEIEIPKCPKCDVPMCQVIGKEAFRWICLGECDNG